MGGAGLGISERCSRERCRSIRVGEDGQRLRADVNASGCGVALGGTGEGGIDWDICMNLS